MWSGCDIYLWPSGKENSLFTTEVATYDDHIVEYWRRAFARDGKPWFLTLNTPDLIVIQAKLRDGVRITIVKREKE